MAEERTLDVFPALSDDQRLVIATRRCEQSGQQFVLRQETFSSDVGWFVQSRIVIEPEQLSGLKAALTGGQIRTAEASAPASTAPAVLPFKAAVAG